MCTVIKRMGYAEGEREACSPAHRLHAAEGFFGLRVFCLSMRPSLRISRLLFGLAGVQRAGIDL